MSLHYVKEDYTKMTHDIGHGGAGLVSLSLLKQATDEHFILGKMQTERNIGAKLKMELNNLQKGINVRSSIPDNI